MQDEVTQARIEHLRGEIRRCDEAIEQGTADSWWHIDRDRFRQELDSLTEPRHRHQAEREEEEAHKIGISEGRQEMVREIDLATGGDGEFRWSTEPDRHCPCEEAMKARVIERFHQAERETLARMEAEIKRLREALDEIRDLPGEINPCNYDHDDACELNRQFCYAITVADRALATRQDAPVTENSDEQ